MGAIEGPAVGGGLGLAVVPDFGYVPRGTLCDNFTRRIPSRVWADGNPTGIIGQQNANLMFSPVVVLGATRHAMGLADVLVAQEDVRATAHALAEEIAKNSPLGVVATRATVREGLANRVRTATA